MTTAIVWDEALMQHRYTHEALNRTLRDVRELDRPFGGVTMVFGGDFQQILPVVPKGTRGDIVSASLQRSSLWSQVIVLHLHKNMRLEPGSEEEEFAKWLLDIGHGCANDADEKVLLPEHMICATEDLLISTVYPDLAGAIPPPEYLLERIILAPRNSNVDDLNLKILRHMPGELRSFYSVDTIEDKPGADRQVTEWDFVPNEYLRSLSGSGLPPGELSLKPGCPLILLCNLAPSHGLCNGTRVVLRRASERVLEVQIVGGEHNAKVALIPRISLKPSGRAGQYTFTLRRLQFPVRLAFAISINKAQGQSVCHVGIDLRQPVFTHGQLYVALSRATSSHRVHVLLPEDAGQRVLNVVYPEVFVA